MKQTAIPNKLYFRIGEVAGLLAVKPYVLRYWETEFPDIRPIKSKSGQRRYKRRDVELLVQIKDLLYQDRFTINGARKQLKSLVRSDRPGEVDPQMALSWQVTGHHPAPVVLTEPRPVVPPTPVVAKKEPTPAPVVAPVKVAAPVTGGDQKKLFAKIKKDLQLILEDLKA